MASWPDGVPIPKPEKPEGITDWEWTVYQNSDYRQIPPDLKVKVHHAMGWKVKDTEDAEEIAEQIADIVAPLLGKGHVPEENMARYTRLRELHHLISRMGNMVSGLGEYEDANTLWGMAGKYKRMANELRADLPAADLPAADGSGGTSPQP